jgi:hypothetical protein
VTRFSIFLNPSTGQGQNTKYVKKINYRKVFTGNEKFQISTLLSIEVFGYY